MTGVVLTRWYRAAGATALATLGVAAVLAVVPPGYALAGALLTAGTVATYRLPVISLSLLLVVGIGPAVLSQADLPWLATITSLGKLSLADAVLSAMLLAVAIRVTVWLAGPLARSRGLAIALAVSVATLFAWIAVSIARNLNVYGIHTTGQFRYSYLIVVAAVYAAVFLRSAAQRRRMCVVLIAMSVVVTLAAVPVIGSFKGWSSGPASRFFPASVSLGLLYGWAALFLAGERGQLGVSKWLARGLAFPVVGLLLVDSHRSVWLAALVLLACLFLSGRIRAGASVKVSVFAGMVIALILGFASLIRPGTLGGILQRAGAILAPASDQTSSWRLGLWAANLSRWWQHPMAGDGFGSYYAGNAAQGVTLTLTPHSVYVETLVAMGAVGLALFLACIATATAILWTSAEWQRRRRIESLDATLVEFGLGVLFSALAYIAVYPFEYYSGLWVGLALAAALQAPAVGRTIDSQM